MKPTLPAQADMAVAPARPGWALGAVAPCHLARARQEFPWTPELQVCPAGHGPGLVLSMNSAQHRCLSPAAAAAPGPRQHAWALCEGLHRLPPPASWHLSDSSQGHVGQCERRHKAQHRATHLEAAQAGG